MASSWLGRLKARIQAAQSGPRLHVYGTGTRSGPYGSPEPLVPDDDIGSPNSLFGPRPVVGAQIRPQARSSPWRAAGPPAKPDFSRWDPDNPPPGWAWYGAKPGTAQYEFEEANRLANPLTMIPFIGLAFAKGQTGWMPLPGTPQARAYIHDRWGIDAEQDPGAMVTLDGQQIPVREFLYPSGVPSRWD